MDYWFGVTSVHTFQPFSTSHLLVLAVAVGGMIIFGCYRRLFQERKLREPVKQLLFFLLLTSELSYQIWAVHHGIWRFGAHLPFHLCGIASIIAMAALVSGYEKLIQTAFFIGIVPAFLALVTPDLPYDYHHFLFWKFFIHHTVIVWASFFVALLNPAVITLWSLIRTYFYLTLYGLAVGLIINPLAGSNYLYLSRTPAANTPLDLLGTGISYYISLGITAFALFLFLYWIWRFFTNKKTNRLFVTDQQKRNSS